LALRSPTRKPRAFDIVTTRADAGTFVTTSSRAEGVDFEHKRTVRIRNRYDADVPVVVGPVGRGKPVFVEDVRFLRGQTKRRISSPSRPHDDGGHALRQPLPQPREARARVRAILNQEARDSKRCGADVISVDEPAFNVYMDESPAWGVERWKRLRRASGADRRAHCYGYGIKANVDWKKNPRFGWRQYESTFPPARAIEDRPGCRSSARIHTFRSSCSGFSRGKDVMVGAIDVANDTVEMPEQVAAAIRSAMKFVPPEKLYPHQLRHGAVAREVALGKLKALAAGAALVRREIGA